MSLLSMGRRWLSRIGCECPLCGARVAGARLCQGCATDITGTPPGMQARCRRCALRLPAGAAHCASCLGAPRAYARTIAAFDYAPPADALIRMLKTQLRLSMAPVLARVLADAMLRDGALPTGTVLVPVPASRASLRLRGMNPAGEIARGLAAELGLPLVGDALRRRRETPRQSSLNRQARRRGAVGLFQASAAVAGHHVALVDDVMTTGSTVQAAATALLAAGAASVTVLVVARTP
ncbi:phosphoribosyltransferase family protein [Achromobacter seleniivolatilans]|uniref:Phosphoribosyltransferase family protein n=1 Tax=Achromobacter seleniivolatilans TaxID=3047478 RepID=A0ABY9LXZ6_9BURK|nr:phosphoribosyltransferase family protein [Achromobacter sp. R39]WMD19565.1 phosphoribosyltransferase family protein [Achromobacter sp. R39]